MKLNVFICLVTKMCQVFLAEGISATPEMLIEETIYARSYKIFNRTTENYLGGSSVLRPLIRFLLGHMSQRQVVINHDDTLSDVSHIARDLHENAVDTIQVEYTSSFSSLRNVLTSAIYSEKVKNVLMLLSTDHIIEVFQMIRDHSLETPSIRWMIIAEGGILKTLQNILREGTQVAVAVKKQNSIGYYRIYSSDVNSQNQYSFRYFGYWSLNEESVDRCNRSSEDLETEGQSTKARDPGIACKRVVTKYQGQLAHSLSYRQKFLFPPIERTYNDFQGRRLVVSALDNVPYFKLRRLRNGTAIPESGVDFFVIEAVSHRLNFTFSILEPPDGRFGGVELDGSVSGIVGMVANRRAHFGINEITITVSRETVTDFTIPYIIEGTNLVSKAPTKIDPVFAVFHPFTPMIWLLIIATTALIGPIAYAIRSCNDSLTNHSNHIATQSPMNVSFKTNMTNSLFSNSEDDTENFTLMTQILDQGSSTTGNDIFSYCFNIFRSLVYQGNMLVEEKLSTRIVFIFWYVFAMVIYSLYGGTLTAFMMVPAYQKPIDSPEDLLDAYYKDGFVPAVQPSTSNEYFFKSAKSGIFKKLWALTDPSRSFPKSGKEAMERVLTQDIVYMSGNLNTEIRTRQRGRHLFHLSREKFQVQGFGIVCRTGSPYIQNVNTVLLEITQAGLINKWVGDEIRKLSSFVQLRAGKQGEAVPISIRHVQACFYVLLCGYLLSFIFFVTEFVCGKKITPDASTTLNLSL